eukprot:gene6250-7781_t
MSTVKLDFVRGYEQEIQKEWEETKAWEIDAADSKDQEKFMATFPYPYMNGRLHIGHVFTVTKADFMCNYQRLKGKNVLFPFAFHCTGMPIKVCADKLKREIELYGNPPVFPVATEEPKEQTPAPTENKPKTKEDPLSFKSKKTKAASKSDGSTTQWEIMKKLGISDEEIPKFADSAYWLNYFPPYCMEDLKSIGMGIDWRRSFITTDVNGYYDSFVRWQFETLKDLGKVKFGKRYSIWSPTDNQQCADHERAQGEGVQPQNYTLIKMEVVEPVPEVLKPIYDQGKKIYFVPGTLRPETMYGQTNCWILPEGNYGAFEMVNNEVFVCTERSARNMSYQELTPVTGEYKCLASFKGQQVIGTALKSPLAIHPVIYVLPMLSIDEEMGTGVVSSVPSDSADDYAALTDLKNKAPLRAKFGVRDEWVLPFEVVSIIEIPGYSDTSAVKAYNELGIKSQNDKVLLAKAKDLLYLRGFNEGVMKVGDYAGQLIFNVKKLIKDDLVNTGRACNYSEPTSRVVSRSGDDCVVALTDQWYINYGEDDPEWRDQVLKNLNSMETYAAETKKKFEYSLGWLNQWACSRTFGLGTRLPWDEKFLIESLSDSTIYMAFYTIAHLLQGDINGSKPGTAGVLPSQMTRAVWDYVLLDRPYPEGCGISKETLAPLKKEFNYWYPVDLRVSGIDLVQNHLTFFLYNHAAIFPQDKQPRGIRANGFVNLNGEKMSKSTGNFLTLFDSIQKYSADGTRIALADAGDGIDNSNFVEKTAVTSLLTLHTQVTWAKECLDNLDKFVQGPADRLQDIIFESEINRIIEETEKAYQRTAFRDALQLAFFALQDVRDYYKSTVQQMNRDLIIKYLETQAIILFPITPHYSQKLFSMLGKGSILKARWPAVGNINHEALKKNNYLKSTIYNFRMKMGVFIKTKSKGKPTEVRPEKATVFYSKQFPQWQSEALRFLQTIYDDDTRTFKLDNNSILEEFKKIDILKPQLKNIMGFVAILSEEVKTLGRDALQTTLTFDESELLKENMDYILKTLELPTFEVQEFASEQTTQSKGAPAPTPGRPTFNFQ